MAFFFISQKLAGMNLAGQNVFVYSVTPVFWGGTSYAFQAGILAELIKILGDWHSEAVVLYLTITLQLVKCLR